MVENWTTVVESSQVSAEILEAAEQIADGWFAEGRIDWTDFLDRLDGMELSDGTTLDLGEDMGSPAIRKLRKHVQAYLRD